jgi:hypothetical protein
MKEYPVKEEDLARALGLTRDTVRQLRGELLQHIEDFEKIGREIRYSEGAVKKLRWTLKKHGSPGARLGDLAVLNVIPQDGESEKPTVVLDAKVTTIYKQNPKYMEAILGGQTVTVRVKKNTNFVPGMTIKGDRLKQENARLYDFIGRCPRARGRW